MRWVPSDLFSVQELRKTQRCGMMEISTIVWSGRHKGVVMKIPDYSKRIEFWDTHYQIYITLLGITKVSDYSKKLELKIIQRSWSLRFGFDWMWAVEARVTAWYISHHTVYPLTKHDISRIFLLQEVIFVCLFYSGSYFCVSLYLHCNLHLDPEIMHLSPI